jgi:hypothetical protein
MSSSRCYCMHSLYLLCTPTLTILGLVHVILFVQWNPIVFTWNEWFTQCASQNETLFEVFYIPWLIVIKEKMEHSRICCCNCGCFGMSQTPVGGRGASVVGHQVHFLDRATQPLRELCWRPFDENLIIDDATFRRRWSIVHNCCIKGSCLFYVYDTGWYDRVADSECTLRCSIR